MPQSKYAADIQAIKIAQVESKGLLANIADQQKKTLAAVEKMTDCLGDHDRKIVALETWQTGHKEKHEGMTGDISGLRKRINAAATANALWAPVASVIAVVFGQQQ